VQYSLLSLPSTTDIEGRLIVARVCGAVAKGDRNERFWRFGVDQDLPEAILKEIKDSMA